MITSGASPVKAAWAEPCAGAQSGAIVPWEDRTSGSWSILVPEMRLDRRRACCAPVALVLGGAEQRHNGEVFACAFSPDGQMVLSGGWDGQLRLWEVNTGRPVTALPAANKALSACAITPDGRQWLSGSLEGMLVAWDPATHQLLAQLMAHTRPISSIVFAPDGATLATTSWDRTTMIWNRLQEREGRCLTGHEDIVAGCRFTPEGSRLLSWSHDRTLRLWDTATGHLLFQLSGHLDRVTAAAVSPSGTWAASGGRDRLVKLWNLGQGTEERSVCLGAEVRGCFFLLDGETLVTVDVRGKMDLFNVPDLGPREELLTRRGVQCSEMSPLGQTIALGCDDGRVRFVAVDGLDGAALVVTPTHTIRAVQSRLERWFGRHRMLHAYACICPRCRTSFEVPDGSLGQAAICPNCQRPVRVSQLARSVESKE